MKVSFGIHSNCPFTTFYRKIPVEKFSKQYFCAFQNFRRELTYCSHLFLHKSLNDSNHSTVKLSSFHLSKVRKKQPNAGKLYTTFFLYCRLIMFRVAQGSPVETASLYETTM